MVIFPITIFCISLRTYLHLPTLLLKSIRTDPRLCFQKQRALHNQVQGRPRDADLRDRDDMA